VLDLFIRLAVMSEGEFNDIGNLGAVQWKLCLCLLLAWILVAMFVSKGIKSSGKVRRECYCKPA
jgi:Sodium:neurotransmitter symporter family